MCLLPVAHPNNSESKIRKRFGRRTSSTVRSFFARKIKRASPHGIVRTPSLRVRFSQTETSDTCVLRHSRVGSWRTAEYSLEEWPSGLWQLI